MKKQYLMIAALATVLTACSNDDVNVVSDGPVEAQISAGVSGPVSRAMDDQWETDAIGVMVTAAPTSGMEDLYKNVKYTTTANTNAPAIFKAETGAGIFFQDAEEEVTFAAYGPYESTTAANILPGSNGVITKSTEVQDTRDEQRKFDYIYASGAKATQSTKEVQFKKVDAVEDHSFAHKMTRLVIIVQTSATDGFTAGQVTGGTYTLSGLLHNGTFDVKTGTATATGTTTANWSLNNNSWLTPNETTQCTFTSILYPQNIGSALTFTATIDEKNYSNNEDITPELQPGKSYEYTITVKKTGLEVSGCTITGWGVPTTGSGVAKM